jgi:hypothetical protein
MRLQIVLSCESLQWACWLRLINYLRRLLLHAVDVVTSWLTLDSPRNTRTRSQDHIRYFKTWLCMCSRCYDDLIELGSRNVLSQIKGLSGLVQARIADSWVRHAVK